MRVATANLGRGVSSGKLRANVVRLAWRMRGGVVAFQEIDEADTAREHATLRRVMGAGWWFGGVRTRTPVAVPRTWRRAAPGRAGGRVTLATKGVQGVTPVRNVVSILISSRTRRQLPPVAVVNTHYPYDNPKLSPSKRAAARAGWANVHAVLRDEVAYWADSRGVSVFITADTNDRNCPPPHPDAVLLVGHGSIDKVWFVRRSVAFKLQGTGTVNLTIDNHDAHVVRGQLTAV